MHAGPSAPMPVSVAYAHCLPAPVRAPIACPVPNLPTMEHGWMVPQEVKNANFLASTHDPLPKFLHIKPSLAQQPKNLETVAAPEF